MNDRLPPTTEAPTSSPSAAPVYLLGPTPKPTMGIALDWAVSEAPYPVQLIYVGETVTFHYIGHGENTVYMHRATDCNTAGRILVGNVGAGSASYTFPAGDAGLVITFASDVDENCAKGQLVHFMVMWR